MTDQYAELRAALAEGPTPGPWSVRYDYVVQAKSFDKGRLVPIAQPYGLRVDGSDLFANAALIAACDPDTIRALLEERDELKAENERLREQLRLATVDQATAEAEANDAHADNERLRQDAERYRWLRDREIPEWLDLWHQNPDRIDDAIDAAMAKGEQQ